MRDRIPRSPGRVKITRDDGTAEYVYLERSDDPDDPGTPLTKETLLKDQTETALFGNAADRTVDETFAGIAARLKMIADDMASITLTVKDARGNPMAGVYVENVFTDIGATAMTNDSGVINGYVSEGEVTIRIKNCGDIVDISDTFTAAKGQAYTRTLTVTTRNFLKVTSSRSIYFSKNVQRVDGTFVAAGGSGAYHFPNSGGSPSGSAGAGGGGQVIVQENLPFTPSVKYPISIGAGAAPATVSNAGNFENGPSDGKDGGNTSFMGITAVGGKGGKSSYLHSGTASGGTGDGPGGNGGTQKNMQGGNGTAASKLGYTSFTEFGDYSGGAGASAWIGYPTSAMENWTFGRRGMGAGKGGHGSGQDQTGTQHTMLSATNGTDGGGGGGGDTGDMMNPSKKSGAGGSGCVAIRMHLKSAA